MAWHARSPVFTLMNVHGFPSRHNYIEVCGFVALVTHPGLYLFIEREVASYLGFPEMNYMIHVKAICC